ncbi:hypothetical protein H5410_050261 [Solanum commersonii]|uniref:Uncharacterized protein n=1 Tax=Solanum commersonii TaxID=4109 RepID=A0A9J5WV14_SOLCO|nr:hypothetical protein H5410_050261 [Solanum commersonii]
MTKVPKLDFLNKFKEANFFETEDHVKIVVLYFISTFLTGQYVNFPWGNECFWLTLKACSCRLGKNPTSFKFSQFHLALQIWFYECCHPFDNTIVSSHPTGSGLKHVFAGEEDECGPSEYCCTYDYVATFSS